MMNDELIMSKAIISNFIVIVRVNCQYSDISDPFPSENYYFAVPR
jgi:hypothetical protein